MLTMSIIRHNVNDVIEIIEDIKSKLTFIEKNLSYVKKSTINEIKLLRDSLREQIEQSLKIIYMSLKS